MNYLVWLFFSLLLTACSYFNPEYHKPNIDIRDSWEGQTINNEKSTINLPENAWWQQYQDPELNEWIALALKNNNNIQVALANIEVTENQLQTVEFAWVPNLPLLIGHSTMPAIGAPGYFFGMFPSYVLNIFKQIKLQDKLEYDIQAREYAYQTVKLAIISQTITAYFTLLSNHYELNLYQDLLMLSQDYLALNTSRYTNGINSADDMDISNSEIHKIKAQIETVKHNIVLASNALHLLTNQNAYEIITSNGFDQIELNQYIPTTLPLQTLKNRPDIQAAEAQLKSANESIGVASSDLFPNINLGLFLHNAYGSSINNTPNLLYPNEEFVSLPLDLTTFGKINTSHASYKSQSYQYIQTVRKALLDVENDISAYNRYASRLGYLERAYDQFNNHCLLASSRYENGITDQLEIVDCQMQLVGTEISINQNKLEALMAVINLYQNLGAGYLVNQDEHNH